ncbi:autotransporter-associated beta strand repeat-containing protein [Acidithiobacillus sp. HP-6]|uniref:autotransporter-associated beta strand repeat-containing protein n=1 Tax=unclassified Acidithiobacillus TaxID=2614800 RepID=UPI00187ADC5E|nr:MULTISPECIES: autotransporter-associated beta strand repeat-containing protein [unclassified Acidithiobacillus]MBE7564380.1 autotransporter-associated beta strand repeat-containing protein [Acidithiobacillus sp. HP-6]MBE7569741.1 autotransporter-associated beta strand repeat-containing protein [Acidithiobacillus sp. HP-2]
MDSPITADGSGSLYSEATGNIPVNANISSSSSTSPLNLYLWAGYSDPSISQTYTAGADPTAAVDIGQTANAKINTGGGNVDINTGDATHAGGAVNIGIGSIAGNINTGGGALTVNATGITQGTASGDALTVGGTSTFNAGAGVLDLGSSVNDFTGAVSLNNSGTNGVTLNNGSHALELGTSSVGSSLDVTAGNISLTKNVTVGSTVVLDSGGTIDQTGGILTAGTLTGRSAGSTTLDGANLITDLGSFTAAGFSLSDANTNGLTVNGPVDSVNGTTPEDVTLSTTKQDGDLTIDGTVDGAKTTLTSDGDISEGANGVIDASNLTGSSVGSTTLDGVNLITDLGSFKADGFRLTNAQNLTVSSGATVNGGNSTDLTTTKGGNLTIDGTVDGTTTTLTSAGTIGEGAGGVISATDLTGSSVGSTTLDGANLITDLGIFTAAGFSLTNAQALTVNGPLTTTGNTGTIDLTTTKGELDVNTGLTGGAITLNSAGNLPLTQNISGSTVVLDSGGTIDQTGGILTAGTLTGRSAGSTTLDGANLITDLGSFKADGFSLTNAQSLTVSSGATVNGGNSTDLTTTKGGNLTIDGTVDGTTTTLTSDGDISEGANGAIVASNLTGSSVGGATLNTSNNSIANLDTFTNTGSGGLTLTDNQALNIVGAISAKSFILNDSNGVTLTSSITAATTLASGTELQIGNGSTSGSITGAITDNGALNFDQPQSDVATLNNIISGSGSVIQSGTGSLTLSGVNTYSGGTTLNSGTTSIGSADNLGSGAITFDGGTLETTAALTDAAAIDLKTTGTLNNGGNNDTLSGIISGSGSIALAGSGTTTLSGVNTYSGGTTINGGTLALTGTGSIADSSGVTDNASFDISGVTSKGGARIASLKGTGTTTLGSNNLTLTNASGTDSGSISGTGGLVLTKGTETLSGANTYSGGTTVDAGTLNVASGGTLGDGALNVASGATTNLDNTAQTITDLNGAGVLNLNGDTLTTTGSGTDSFSGVIGEASGTTGAPIMDGTGSLTLSGVNTYSGGTTLNSGTTSIGSADNLGSGAITFDGGTLETTAALTDAAAIDLKTTGTLNNGGNNDTLSGIISGSGSIALAGSGTTTLSGVNTYSGGTTVDGGGLLSVDSGNSVGTGSITLNSGALGSSAGVASVALSNVISIGGNGGALIGTDQTSIDPTTSNALTLTGKLSGTGTLQTQGTIIDNGTGGTSGGTTVANGLLEVGDINHAAASLSGPVTVDSGAYLRGHGTIIGNVTNSGTVFPGGTIGILTVNGNYVQNPGSTLDIEVTPNDSTPGVGYDQLNVTGTAALNGKLAVQVGSGTYTVGEQYDIVHADGGVSGTFSGETYNPLFAGYLTPQISYGAQDVYLKLTGTPQSYNSGSGVADNLYGVNESLQSAMGSVMDGSQGVGGSSPTFTATHVGSWAKGLGGFGRANGADVMDYGGVAGYGKAITHHLVLGAAFSGMGTQTRTQQQAVSGKSFGLYGYGIYAHGALRISGTLGTGLLSASSNRNLDPTGMSASGSTSGWFFGSGVQAQYLVPLGQTFLMPYVSATYLHAHLNPFAEQGAGLLNLSYSGQTANLGTFTGGLRAGTDIKASGLTWIPWVEVGGTGTAGNRHNANIETLGLTTSTEIGQIAPADSLDTGAGLTIKGKGPWTAKVAYVGQFAGNTHFNTFDLTANYRW